MRTGVKQKMNNGSLLSVRKLSKHFGGLNAVDTVDFDVEKDSIKSIIGPNGAGKTTIFNMLAGSFQPSDGTIMFDGKDISKFKAHSVANMGIARTFQNVKLFGNMNVLQNVMTGLHCRTKSGFAGAILRLPSMLKEEAATRASAMKQLEFTGLADKAEFMASSLAFGRQRLLEIARALAMKPKLLLLDEPAAGLNTRETSELASLICKIRDNGVTVLLVEHDMSLVMEISDEVLVLDFGKKLVEGTPREVQNNPEVVRIYLGQDYSQENNRH